MNKPLVSIVMPCFNGEKYLSQSIEAIQAQTFSNFELILINDGSLDGTLQLMELYKRGDGRIKIINNETNLGLVASLNKGLKASIGKYIARTDSDDITQPNWLETLVTELENNPEIIALGSWMEYIQTKTGKLTNFKDGEIATRPINNEEISEDIIGYCPIFHPTAVFRREVFEKHGIFYKEEYKHAEDYMFWVEVARLGKIINIPKPLVKYRLHQNQVSSQHRAKQIEVTKKIRRKAFEFKVNDKFNDLNFSFNVSDEKMIEQIKKLLPLIQNITSNKRLQSDLIFGLVQTIKQPKLNQMWQLFNTKSNLKFKYRIKFIKYFFRTNKYQKDTFFG